ncbi:MAG: serine protease [Alphaproteobacteria bacterium]|nr:serine protease [Alphaproteobacteria bacterium]
MLFDACLAKLAWWPVAGILLVWLAGSAPAQAAQPIALYYPYFTGAQARIGKIKALAERVSQSYVHVVILYPGNPDTNDPPGILQQASGIIVDARGHIVTAAHIARTSKNEARIIVRDGSEHAARILYIDPKQDLALLKVAPFAGMKPAIFAAENTVRQSNFAIAVGSPSRGRGAVSMGFVRLPRLNERLAYNRWGIINAIEISMEVESGHSGGPVFNRRGELIGMIAGYELGDTTKRPYISPRITYAIPIAGIRDFLMRAVGR